MTARGRRSPLEVLVGEERYPATLAWAAAAFSSSLLASALLAMATAVEPAPHVHRGAVLLICLVALALVALFAPLVRAGHTGIITVFAAAMPPLPCYALALLGPGRQEGAVVIAAFAAGVFLFVAVHIAMTFTGLFLAGYGVVLAVGDGYANPVSRWVLVAGSTATVAALMTWTIRHLEALARSEREANAKVAAANRTLQQFLSPQVASTVLASDDGRELEPHRRRIAVLFADLRGFTKFTSGAEPEDVVEVLAEFYATFGDQVRGFDATFGSFAGDGVMAYFNDPFPCEDPPGRAVDLALALRGPMADLLGRWRTRGHDLGYGVGIAYGYATLGIVGFEGRRDYTALGSVVNLAARLCGEAADGEILLDARAHDALAQRVTATSRAVVVKGFADPVAAFSVTSPSEP